MEEDFFLFLSGLCEMHTQPIATCIAALDPIQLLASIWEALPRINIVCNNFSRKDIESSQKWNSLRVLALGGVEVREDTTLKFVLPVFCWFLAPLHSGPAVN